MNLFKKQLCFLLNLIFMLSILPCNVFAEEMIASGQCGNDVFWCLTEDGLLTISGSGEMDSFSSPKDTPWYSHCKSGAVQSVTFLPGVCSVGDRAFYDCDTVSEITLSDSIVKIGQYAFFSCDGLKSVFIPSSVTSIGYCSLSGCRSLETIQVSLDNTHYANDMCGVLYTKDYSTLLSAPGALSGSYTVSEATTSIWSAFDNCDDLLHVYLPKNLDSISEGTFKTCKNLQGIWVDQGNPYYFSDSFGVLYGPPHWGKQNRTAILCVPVTLSGPYQILDGTEVIECHAFTDCILLTDIVMPQATKEISYGSFANCVSLSHLSIPDSVTLIDFGAFENCSGLIHAKLPKKLAELSMTAFKGCINLETVLLPDTLVSIGSSAFADCISLSHITLPETVQSIGSQAFANCTGLKNVIFLGDAPSFEKGLFGERDVFLNVTAACCYPAGNDTWTTPVLTDVEIGNSTVSIPMDPRQSYMGEITWIVSETMKGDANRDGAADYADALLVLRSSIGLEELAPNIVAACDLNGDGQLNYSDALLILRRSIGLEG